MALSPRTETGRRKFSRASQLPNSNTEQPNENFELLSPLETSQNDGSNPVNGFFGGECALTSSLTSRESDPSSPYTPHSLVLSNPIHTSYQRSHPDLNDSRVLDCSPHNPTNHSSEGSDIGCVNEPHLFRLWLSPPERSQNLFNGPSLITHVGQGTNPNIAIPIIDANQETTLGLATEDLDAMSVGDVEGEPWHPYRQTRFDEPGITRVQEPPDVDRIGSPLLYNQTYLTYPGLPLIPRQTNAQSTNNNVGGLQRSNHGPRHHGPRLFPCTCCHRTFKSPKDLKRHCNSKHSDHKRYKCPFCESANKRKDNCRRHILHQHHCEMEPLEIPPPKD